MVIREYRPEDEQGWVRCRVLSFLNTAYFDHVLQEKEKYIHPAIELVAIEDGKVVGLIDIEYELKERTVCSRGTGLGGMIWHIAIHPDYQRQGIATKLLNKAIEIAKPKGLNRFEAWTRDDKWVNEWYNNTGFLKVDAYLHVFMDGGEEVKGAIKSEIANLHPVQAFAHYVGEDEEEIKNKFARVHECSCFEKELT
ncbi:GNAT family N-acetyltransferase [Paenibacillus sp. SGZ-1009]|uniref:GNAT family N-acetyltransferase n=1 Tax=Paenibacillus campi TaxID=3106031 RepID=UPI002AFFBAD6|nr:GNAT family N-acetyltransferase [Paenibacillus sp. SGZ-1009]